MLGDYAPDVVFSSFAYSGKFDLLMSHIRAQGLRPREIRFFSVAVPLNDDYDRIINWFKHFTGNIGQVNIPIAKILNNKMLKMTGFKLPNRFVPINLVVPRTWETDYANPLCTALVTPLLVQDNTHKCSTKQEKKNMEKLKSFDSDGYEPDLEGLSDATPEESFEYNKELTLEELKHCDNKDSRNHAIKCFEERTKTKWKKEYEK